MAMEQPTTNIDLSEAKQENGDHIPINTHEEIEVPIISEERRIEINNEMAKLDDEINTLKQALLRKERQLSDLRAEMGITRWTRIQNSESVKQSKQALYDASVKTGNALSAFGSATANKWTEIKESPRMQTVSEKFWSTTGAVKAKIVGEPPMNRAISREPPAAQLANPDEPN